MSASLCSRCSAPLIPDPADGGSVGGVLEVRHYRSGGRTMFAKLDLCVRCLELLERALEKWLGRRFVVST